MPESVECLTSDAASESDLVDRAISGDRAAIVALLERHGPALRHQLEGKLAQRWQSVLSVEDVLQETYADVLLSVGSFRPDGDDAFARWLSRIARNNLLDALRALTSQRQGGDWQRVPCNDPAESSLNLLENLQVTLTTASQDARRHEAIQLLQEALSTLPRAYQEVVRTYDLTGCSAAQAAETLGCSEGALYMRRARALRLLRARLAKNLAQSKEFPIP